MKRDRSGRSRRIAAWSALGVLSTILVMALAQCQMIQDRLVDVHLEKAKSSENCFAACAHAYNDSIRTESDLHVSNVHGCAGDSTCLALEELRHEAAVDRIQAGRRACQADCHHQGGGSGGR